MATILLWDPGVDPFTLWNQSYLPSWSPIGCKRGSWEPLSGSLGVLYSSGSLREASGTSLVSASQLAELPSNPPAVGDASLQHWINRVRPAAKRLGLGKRE